ncbi:MAG: hypothetical protein J2P41_23895 [Blastocatellia bacterium]|nr:hypothetical protein [Blastocatellia bacterium]
MSVSSYEINSEVVGEIALFWSLFRLHADSLAAYKLADNPIYCILLDQLHRIHPELYLEYCSEPGAYQLIITAEGNRSLFPLARAVVSVAPVIDGWTIHALKPQIGCPETAHWDDLTLRLADIVFEPLERDGSNDLGLRIFVPGIEEKDIGTAHNVLLRALDHILGEEKFAEAVQHTEVLRLTANITRKDYISLSDLAAFIDWRQKKLYGG